ncbi:MAG: hypothetical protein MI747_04085 [Desulfobacterales bacterium]|nr:hypothetical protein [Desulfobacterales bacterium]
MKLCSRIILITFLIIFFVQGLNCFLEIGFLADNLMENSQRKYRLLGTELQRKLNISLVFGKPLDQLKYDRLLSGLINEDLENLHVRNPAGQTVYSLRPNRRAETGVEEMGFLLSDRHGVKGQMILVISHQAVRDRLLSLVQKSILFFLVILGISLPLLYFFLTRYIQVPHERFVQSLEQGLASGDVDGLSRKGVVLSPLADVDRRLMAIRSGQWLDRADLYPHGPEQQKKLQARLLRRLNTH